LTLVKIACNFCLGYENSLMLNFILSVSINRKVRMLDISLAH